MDTNKAKEHEFLLIAELSRSFLKTTKTAENILIVRADTIKASADRMRLSADAIRIFSKGFFSPRIDTKKAKGHEFYIF